MKDETEFVLILGAGIFQVPLIRYVKKCGYKTLVISNLETDPGKQYADVFLNVSTVKVHEILDAVQSYPIKAVLSAASESALPSIARLNQTWNFKGMSVDFIHLITNKVAFKKRLLSRQINTPSCVLSWREFEKSNHSRWIQKPIFGNGSRDVMEYNGETQAPDFFDHFFLEERIDGQELGGDFVVKDGKLVFFLHSFKTNNSWHVPVCHQFVSQPNQPSSLKTFLNDLIEKTPLQDGIYNFDIIQNHKGEYFLIDIGARIGGNCIPELVKLKAGINEYDLALRGALGLPMPIEIEESELCFAVYILGANANGVLSAYNEEAIHRLKQSGSIVDYLFTRKPGDYIPIFDCGNKNAGYIIYKANNALELQQLTNEIQAIEWMKLC